MRLGLQDWSVQRKWALSSDSSLLGKGAFSEVHRGYNTISGKESAIKVLKKQVYGNSKDVLLGEVEVLRDILLRLPCHPGLVQLLEAFEDAKHVYLVTTLCHGWLLGQLLEVQQTLPEPYAAWIFKQVVSTLRDLHRAGIVHRDVKPDNIIFSLDNPASAVKLIDFGMSSMRGVEDAQQEIMGTENYVAPEVLSRQAYSPAVDMWSSGVMLYRMLSGNLPFSTEAAVQTSPPGFREAVWRNTSAEARDLVIKLLNKEPLRRISAEQVLRHKWLQVVCEPDVQPRMTFATYRAALKHSCSSPASNAASTSLQPLQRLLFSSQALGQQWWQQQEPEPEDCHEWQAREECLAACSASEASLAACPAARASSSSNMHTTATTTTTNIPAFEVWHSPAANTSASWGPGRGPLEVSGCSQSLQHQEDEGLDTPADPCSTHGSHNIDNPVIRHCHLHCTSAQHGALDVAQHMALLSDHGTGCSSDDEASDVDLNRGQHKRCAQPLAPAGSAIEPTCSMAHGNYDYDNVWSNSPRHGHHRCRRHSHRCTSTRPQLFCLWSSCGHLPDVHVSRGGVHAFKSGEVDPISGSEDSEGEAGLGPRYQALPGTFGQASARHDHGPGDAELKSAQALSRSISNKNGNNAASSSENSALMYWRLDCTPEAALIGNYAQHHVSTASEGARGEASPVYDDATAILLGVDSAPKSTCSVCTCMQRLALSDCGRESEPQSAHGSGQDHSEQHFKSPGHQGNMLHSLDVARSLLTHGAAARAAAREHAQDVSRVRQPFIFMHELYDTTTQHLPAANFDSSIDSGRQVKEGHPRGGPPWDSVSVTVEPQTSNGIHAPQPGAMDDAAVEPGHWWKHRLVQGASATNTSACRGGQQLSMCSSSGSSNRAARHFSGGFVWQPTEPTHTAAFSRSRVPFYSALPSHVVWQNE